MYSVAIEWKGQYPKGRVEVRSGELKSIDIAKGSGLAQRDSFSFDSSDACRLIVRIDQAIVDSGAEPTVVSVFADDAPFSFLLRDVSSEYPIFIPRLEVVVTQADDQRSYDDIEIVVQKLGGQTMLDEIETEDEESFDNAASHTRSMRVPTWLGLSRDIRLFEIDDNMLNFWGQVGPCIKPRYPVGYMSKKHNRGQSPEKGYSCLHYSFRAGRGVGCVADTQRRLEDGVLPIIVGMIVDADITYDYTMFTSLECSVLTKETVKGTHYLVAAASASGFMVTPEQESCLKELCAAEFEKNEETVLYCRIVASNNAAVPRYAWFRAPVPIEQSPDTYYNSGLGSFQENEFFCAAKLNGEPLPKDEVAILLKPGETATMDFALPHSQISKERAVQLLDQDFNSRHAECREYWNGKLQSTAKIQVPEQRISEMIQAGLIHLDSVAYGLEPDGTVAATVGIYAPIGTESAPIIQFMDSMGWHDLARRSLDFFFKTQHCDGFVQNYDGYEVETQAFLWCAGEHYRYTRDDEWVMKNKPRLLKACDYLRAWRERNLKDELRGKGYGLLDGRVADPIDPYRHFLANGYYSLGLSRVAEMLGNIDQVQAEKLKAEAESIRDDVRSAFFDAMGRSPVVPLGDGTWCPTIPAWAEASAPSFMLLDNNPAYTHGTFVGRDSLLGPMYLIFQEVIDPSELAADVIVDYHTDVLYSRNVAFSQPYYSRHPWVHLKRSEVKAFLKAYYNGFSGLSDPNTYDFWEHHFHVSPHKTHEEAWFLMETRWMLYMEEGNTLKLLSGIPRDWMKDGKVIELKNVASYFGSLSLRVESQLEKNRIIARIECTSDRKPERVQIRFPHPDGVKAHKTSIGIYDSVAESVIIESFGGVADMLIDY